MTQHVDYIYMEPEASGKCQKMRSVLNSRICLLCFFLAQLGLSFGFIIYTQYVQNDQSNDAASGTNTTHLWKPKMLPIYKDEPLAKNLVRRFDAYLMEGATFNTPEQKLLNVGQWLAQDFEYDTVGFPSAHSLREWVFSGEESQYRTAFPTTSFSQMLFFGDTDHCTSTTYGNAQWMGNLFGIPAPKQWVYFRVTDFYHVVKNSDGQSLVKYNFMMIDFADLLRSIGRPVLPPAPLPEGFVMTAAANDGVPAPLSVVVAGRDSVSAKLAAQGALVDGWAGNGLPQQWWHEDLTFYGPGGIGLARGAKEYQQHVIEPFRNAFADRQVNVHMLFCEGNYCAASGVLQGQHVDTWVGQKASHKRIDIHFGMHWRVVDGKIKEGWAIFDIPGFFRQLGKDFFGVARAQSATAFLIPG